MQYLRLTPAVIHLCLLAIPLLGASTTGTMVGTVTDPTGAVVTAAKVLVHNQETNAVREVQTNVAGNYSVPLLPPGLYEVAVEMTGFRRVVRKDIKLDVNQTARVDVTLQLGVATEEVVVSANLL